MAKKKQPAARHYEHTPPSVSVWVRVYGRVAARRDRASVLRGFLHENGVERRKDIDLRTLSPDKYLLRTQYLEHLADVRDAHILREAKKARLAQQQLQRNMDETQAVLQKERELLLQLKTDYDETKAVLARGGLTPLEMANQQGKLGALEANVKDQLAVVADLKSELADDAGRMAASRKEFAEFCARVSGVYELAMNGYVKVAGRRLNKLGVTNYDAALRDYADETLGKIKELTDG